MKRVALQLIILLAYVFLFSTMLHAHCEIPCGIYDDKMRVKMISEHIETIEKSMSKINGLEKAGLSHHSNQLVRWIMNKEDHADQLQEIVTQYFMTQRIKFDTKDYEKKLNILHHMLVYAMKCKQTTDIENVEALRKFLKEFSDIYFEKLKNYRAVTNCSTVVRLGSLNYSFSYQSLHPSKSSPKILRKYLKRHKTCWLQYNRPSK